VGAPYAGLRVGVLGRWDGGGQTETSRLSPSSEETGLSVGKALFLAGIKQNICGKVERALLLDTLEVYPLKGMER
jgi:hypothetical protein